VTPFKPTGPFEYRSLILRLRDKIARTLADELPERHVAGLAFHCDSTKPWPDRVPQADAVITSPPFFDSTRFYMANWMRFWFAGWNRSEFDTEPSRFVENRQKVDLDVYRVFFEHTRRRMKATGILVLHLGQSPKCDMGKELAGRVEPWFSVADIFTEGVEHCESHGIRDKGTVAGHTYLVLTPD
jgi:hypothetical protein